MNGLSRRQFLQSGAVLTGASLLVGCGSDGQVIVQPSSSESINDQLWLSIAADNKIQITIPSSEMGQGVNTSCAMLIAEELGCAWADISVVTAPWNKAFNNPTFRMQMTGGSTTISGYWEPLRKVGATARVMLLTAAANQWQTSINNLTANDGYVKNSNGDQLSFGQLVANAALLDAPEEVALKPLSEHQLIGKSMPRFDTPAKTEGKAQFGIDVNFDGLKVATVMHSPVLKGTVSNYDKQAALAVKGVENVVVLEHGIAVVADTYWHAKMGINALKASFTGGEVTLSSASVEKTLRKQLDDEPLPAIKGAAQIFDFEYEVPFLAHATLEPMNCTVKLTEDRCDIWVPSQSQSLTGQIAEKLTDLKQEQIHVHLTYLGGGFGRRGEIDFVAETLEIAKATGKPIKLIWSREEDTSNDFYRPAALTRYRIGVDDNGTPMAWHNQLASPSIFERIFKLFAPGFLSWVPFTRIVDDPVAVEGMKEVPYILEPEFEYLQSKLPVPVGFWRSVGNSYSAFFTESAIDELAHNLGQDPYEYRLKTMHDPRAKKVLKAAAEMAQWGRKDVHQGIAFHKSFGSYVAQIVDLTIDDNKEITLHKVTIVIDSGIVVNPDTVHAQMEGGMIFGLVAAAEGEINFVGGETIQKNFDTYPILRMNQTPVIDVKLLPSGDAPGGVGEPATPPIAPALTNAIFAATGERLRRLPISKAGYRIGTRA